MQEKDTVSSQARVASMDGDSGEKIAVVTASDDKALNFVAEHGAVGPISAEDNKRVLRIIDTRLVPMMTLSLMMNFLDKNALSLSYNFNLTEDIPLVGNQYSWASGSIFYLAYLVFQPIVARLIQKFPLGKVIATAVITWGILLMCTAACRSFATLMVVRFLLGAVESCINPAFMILTSMWYTRHEQPERTGWWNMGLPAGQIFGGLMAYGIGHIKYKDYNPWMWFFIIWGSVSIVWGLFLFYYLPDTPMTARWLSLSDRAIAVERVRQNKTGIVNNKWKAYQFWECLRDPATWFQFSIMVLGTLPSGGVASFGSIVIKGFGFTALNTTLLQMPLGVVQLLTFLIAGRLTSRYKNIRLHLAWVTQIPPLVGAILLYKLPASNKIGRLFCYYIFQTHNLPMIYGMSMVSGNVGGFTKKTTVAAIMFIGYCAGQISGPQVFKADEKPLYPTAFIANFACFALLIVCLWMFLGYLKWQNWRRDKLVQLEGRDANEDHDITDGLHDRTDWEQKKTFRYVY